MKRVDLSGAWAFKAVSKTRTIPPEHANVKEWMPALVPGTVHTDLMAVRQIPDPFFRMNEREVQWVESQRWLYRRVFEVENDVLEADVVHLVAEGLDTYARISINGKIVARTQDMFVEHRIDVKRFLKRGMNVIEIGFDPPVARSKQLEKKHGALNVALEPHRVYVRKAQYSFGWDWGPKLTTSGIWRNIYLEAFSDTRIASVFARAKSCTSRNATVKVDITLERCSRSPIQLRVNIVGEGFEHRRSFKVRGSGASMTVRIPNPHLWWPNGYGDHPLYQVVVTAYADGTQMDMKSVSFGLRSVRLVQEKDREGRSFVLEVNGVKVFCKGANWVPSDNFIPRISNQTYERLLTLARDAHMNMVRVWGGGVYEQDVFYELCDRLGLMVWQDFMFACGEYPEERWFLREVKEEAVKVVTRLRNHPSIVLWCGNNECEWLFCMEHPDKTPDDMSGAQVFHAILPAVCQKLDGTRPFWRSSPFGRGFPNSESNGNHHQWMVWSAWKDCAEYENDRARFVTEFGFQAPANRGTMEEATNPEDRHPQSEVMEHHNKQGEGTERLVRFQVGHFRITSDFDQFIYQGQLVQAEALKRGIEHWRRRKFSTAGSLFWQLNDCWPVSSWSVVDSALTPKAGYYFAKRSFAPVLVSFKRTRAGIEVWGVNDRLQDVRGVLTTRLLTFGGEELHKKETAVMLKRNSSRLLQDAVRVMPESFDPCTCYLVARLVVGGDVASENRYFFTEPKHLRLPRVAIQPKLLQTGLREYRLHLMSAQVARSVRLEVEGSECFFSDNYFDLDAGEPKEVTFQSPLTERELHIRLRIKTL